MVERKPPTRVVGNTKELDSRRSRNPAEVKHGLQVRKDEKRENRDVERKDWRRGRVYGASRVENERKDRLCKVCGEKHPIWTCHVYKSRTVDKRWELAKRYGLVRSHCGARQDHGGGRRKSKGQHTRNVSRR
jgi:hypothetical protein